MLCTFLILSLRRFNRFQPSRVRLSRVCVQTLETDLGLACKKLTIEVGEAIENRGSAQYTTLRKKLDIRLTDPEVPVPYICFMQGAERLLSILRSDDIATQIAEDMKFETNTNATNISQMKDELSDQEGSSSQTITADHAKPQLTIEAECDDFAFTEADSYDLYRFNQNCRGTVLQLQFWLTKGLDTIKAQKSVPKSREYTVLRELVDFLVVYLRPILFFVVKPVLESSESVADLQIAQQYHRGFELLKMISQNTLDSSMLNQLERVLKLDWVGHWSVLEETNNPLIQFRYAQEFHQKSAELLEVIRVRYKHISYHHDLMKFERFTLDEWSEDRNVRYHNRQTSPPEGDLLCTKGDQKLTVGCYQSKLVFRSFLPQTNAEPSNPCLLIVNFDTQIIQRAILLFNENFFVVVDPKNSQIWITSPKKVLLQLESANRLGQTELEVDSSAIFQLHKTIKPRNCQVVRAPEFLSWRALQDGILKIYLAQYGSSHYVHNSTNYDRNEYHLEMLYIDLSNLAQERVISRFDLTTQLFNQITYLPIQNHIFIAMGFTTRKQNQFLVSFLEVHHSYCHAGDANLHLAQFTIKGKKLVPLNYSVYSVKRAELALLDYESRRTSINYRGEHSLQWLFKQGKYFSFAFLTSQKCCLWVHVLHNNRFLPIGRKRQLVPGLAQFGMSQNFVTAEGAKQERSVAFAERKELPSQMKTVYRVFALTVKW